MRDGKRRIEWCLACLNHPFDHQYQFVSCFRDQLREIEAGELCVCCFKSVHGLSPDLGGRRVACWDYMYWVMMIVTNDEFS